MHILKRLYRKDYTGEDVKTVGLYLDQEWHYQKEFVANPFTDLPFNNRAVVIGNGISRTEFDLTHFLPSRETTAWGEFAPWVQAKHKKRFNTYGCNALYRNFQPDFIVATGEDIVKEIADSDYIDDNVVYTNAHTVMEYPEKFHYIPQDPNYNSGAMAAYLAAFDGHKRVFMLGFDGIDSTTDNYNAYAGTNAYPSKDTAINESYWTSSLYSIMKLYDDVEFIRVAPTSTFRSPEAWKYLLNYRTISFRQFVLEADL
jgi:hypothetical protein